MFVQVEIIIVVVFWFGNRGFLFGAGTAAKVKDRGGFVGEGCCVGVGVGGVGRGVENEVWGELWG